MKKYTSPFSEKLWFQQKYNRMPESITVDLEKGLLNAFKHEFTESKIIGCYFHLKQALFRKLKKLLSQEPDIYLVLNQFPWFYVQINSYNMTLSSTDIFRNYG
ncbi:hypothetical protein HZS_5830 [Henneguya salminicola]|nr:hypothetical protein HZS_5830 [Henneguya salminicola]